jgi:hypothetical protein
MATKHTNANHLGHYTPLFANWRPALHGPKPTNEHLATAHGLRLSPGKQAMAIALALRPGGATRQQIMLVSGLFDGNPSPQFNKLNLLVTNGLLKREAGAGAIKVTLTPLGAKFVANNATGTLRSTPSIIALNGGSTVSNPNERPVKAAKADKAAKAPVKPAAAKAPSKPRKPKVKPAEVKAPEVEAAPAPATDTAA